MHRVSPQGLSLRFPRLRGKNLYAEGMSIHDSQPGAAVLPHETTAPSASPEIAKPSVVLVMDERTRRALISENIARQLGDVATVNTAESVTDFADPTFDRVLAAADILLTCWGAPPIDAAALARMPQLRAIVHAAGSIKHLIGPEVFQRNIRVTSAAEVNAIPVAEFTLATIILAAKRVRSFIRTQQETGAGNPWDLPVTDVGNYRRTIGVVGASRVGRRVLDLLRTIDAQVLLADPTLTPESAQHLPAQLVDLDDLCRRSDIITLHAPDLPETHHMLDKDRLALLRDGAIVINTARGSLIDTVALTAEVESGRISAVLDVTDPEPLPADSPLRQLPNVVLTPHVAGSLGNELQRLAQTAVGEIVAFVADQPPHYPVNPASLAQSA